MRNDYGNRPYKPRFVEGKTAKSTPKKQNANDRLDESLARDGKESTKSQSFEDRRDESRGE